MLWAWCLDALQNCALYINVTERVSFFRMRAPFSTFKQIDFLSLPWNIFDSCQMCYSCFYWYFSALYLTSSSCFVINFLIFQNIFLANGSVSFSFSICALHSSLTIRRFYIKNKDFSSSHWNRQSVKLNFPWALLANCCWVMMWFFFEGLEKIFNPNQMLLMFCDEMWHWLISPRDR